HRERGQQLLVGARILVALDQDGVVPGDQQAGHGMGVEIVVERALLAFERVADLGLLGRALQRRGVGRRLHHARGNQAAGVAERPGGTACMVVVLHPAAHRVTVRLAVGECVWPVGPIARALLGHRLSHHRGSRHDRHQQVSVHRLRSRCRPLWRERHAQPSRQSRFLFRRPRSYRLSALAGPQGAGLSLAHHPRGFMARTKQPTKQLRLGAFMRPVSIHTAAWRYPGGTPDANFNLKALIRYAQTLERGRFDAFFMADHLAVLNMPMEALKRSATVTSFDPLTLLPALAMKTEHLGLIATASTTFEPPYTIARRFASLDHISEGRAGWNVVTTSNPDAALNFGMDEQMEHDERYARAREYFDVVTGLWDSWADDAFIRDVDSGIYFDPARLHVLNHRGKYLKVRGPLNIARPIQGWPVVVQAGPSDAGGQLAAETAEVVFAAGGPIEAGRAFYADVKGRAQRYGRNPDHIKILPGAFVVIGESLDEAKDKRALLDSLV